MLLRPGARAAALALALLLCAASAPRTAAAPGPVMAGYCQARWERQAGQPPPDESAAGLGCVSPPAPLPGVLGSRGGLMLPRGRWQRDALACSSPADSRYPDPAPTCAAVPTECVPAEAAAGGLARRVRHWQRPNESIYRHGWNRAR